MKNIKTNYAPFGVQRYIADLLKKNWKNIHNSCSKSSANKDGTVDNVYVSPRLFFILIYTKNVFHTFQTSMVMEKTSNVVNAVEFLINLLT